MTPLIISFPRTHFPERATLISGENRWENALCTDLVIEFRRRKSIGLYCNLKRTTRATILDVRLIANRIEPTSGGDREMFPQWDFIFSLSEDGVRGDDTRLRYHNATGEGHSHQVINDWRPCVAMLTPPTPTSIRLTHARVFGCAGAYAGADRHENARSTCLHPVVAAFTLFRSLLKLHFCYRCRVGSKWIMASCSWTRDDREIYRKGDCIIQHRMHPIAHLVQTFCSSLALYTSCTLRLRRSAQRVHYNNGFRKLLTLMLSIIV